MGVHSEICPRGPHCLGAREKGQPVRKQRACAKPHPNPTQGGLACCDSWGRKESDTTERLN